MLDELPLPPSTAEQLQAMMEKYEIDAAIVSVGPPGAFMGDVGKSTQMARAANDGIAELVRGDPRRFAGLATLPLPDLNASLNELERSLEDLDLDGIMLLTNVAGTYLGDRQLDPLFEVLNEREAYVFVHPGFPAYQPPLSHPVWLYEFPFETVRAVTNLIYSGILERYPKIRIQLSHLGGAMPFLAHRIASLADREPEQTHEAPAGALEYLRRFYYDTGLANNAPGLAATELVTDISHVVFGTDWPYLSFPASGVDPAPDLDVLAPDRREMVESLNVRELVPRLAAQPQAERRGE
jgi:6-methylsalicylate decarboxylase